MLCGCVCWLGLLALSLTAAGQTEVSVASLSCRPNQMVREVGVAFYLSSVQSHHQEYSLHLGSHAPAVTQVQWGWRDAFALEENVTFTSVTIPQHATDKLQLALAGLRRDGDEFLVKMVLSEDLRCRQLSEHLKLSIIPASPTQVERQRKNANVPTQPDPCANRTLCGAHEICTNTENNYTCTCGPGFETTPDDGCADINECSVNSTLCGALPCVNLRGSYRCIDACTLSPCLNGGTCAIVANAAMCNCPSGLTGLKCELQQTCSNLPNPLVLQPDSDLNALSQLHCTELLGDLELRGLTPEHYTILEPFLAPIQVINGVLNIVNTVDFSLMLLHNLEVVAANGFSVLNRPAVSFRNNSALDLNSRALQQLSKVVLHSWIQVDETNEWCYGSDDDDIAAILADDGGVTSLWWFDSTKVNATYRMTDNCSGCPLHVDGVLCSTASLATPVQVCKVENAITNLATLQSLGFGCLQIDGDLTLTDLADVTEDVLFQAFGKITKIHGTFQVIGTVSLVGLDFFANLSYAEAVIITGNLQLVDAKLPNLEPTPVFIHNNQRLCRAAFPNGSGECVDVLQVATEYQVVESGINPWTASQTLLANTLVQLVTDEAGSTISLSAILAADVVVVNKSNRRSNDLTIRFTMTVATADSAQVGQILAQVAPSTILSALKDATILVSEVSNTFGYARFLSTNSSVVTNMEIKHRVQLDNNQLTVSWVAPRSENQDLNASYIIYGRYRQQESALTTLLVELKEWGIPNATQAMAATIMNVLQPLEAFQSAGFDTQTTLSLCTSNSLHDGCVGRGKAFEYLISAAVLPFYNPGLPRTTFVQSNSSVAEIPDDIDNVSITVSEVSADRFKLVTIRQNGLSKLTQLAVVVDVAEACTPLGCENNFQLLMPTMEALLVQSTGELDITGCYLAWSVNEDRNFTHCISPFVTYQIRINSLSAEGIYAVTTDEGVPLTPPENITVATLDARSSGLLVRRPLVPQGRVVAYEVEKNGAWQRFAVDEGDHVEASLFLSGLIPFVNYRFPVRALTASGAGPAQEVEFRTSQDVPPAPAQPELTVTTNGVKISFARPDPPHGIIMGYQVWILNNGSASTVINVTTTTVDLAGLNADADVRVRASTSVGWGPLSQSAAAASSSSSGEESSSSGMAIVAIAASVGVLAIMLAFCGIRRYRNTLGSKWKPRPDDYELNRADIRLEEQIGQGEFGRVFRASALTMERKSVQAAVKVLNWTDKAQNMAFVNEMKVMKQLVPKHMNVLTLLGQVTQSLPMMLVTELCSFGNVRDHLLSSKKDRVLRAELTVDRLTSLASQAAHAMEFITSHSIIHRDVAARNFMLAEDYTLKIGDFGRAIVCEDQAGVQILEDSVPVRWSSPEVLSRDWYSSASDVWAFGIAIFEVFSYGRMVYPGKTNEDVVELILDRRRPDQPLDCPDAIYSTCLQCWSYKASNRPSFAELVGYIGSIERRLRGGAEDQDLACSKRFIEYQRRPTERIAEAAGGFSRSRPGSATSRRSTASQVELLKRTSSTMLFDGGYVLLDSVAGVTDHFIVLDPENADREAAAAIQDEVRDIRELVPQDTPVVIRSQHHDEPVYLPSDLSANQAMDILTQDQVRGARGGFNRKRPQSFKSMVELSAVHET